MSWLFVALIPGLLMLATLGLERIESGLRRDAISATDVAEFLNQAEAGEMDTLAKDGMNNAMHSLQRRLHEQDHEQDSATGRLVDAARTADLPTHQYFHHHANPEFQQTRHANPV